MGPFTSGQTVVDPQTIDYWCRSNDLHSRDNSLQTADRIVEVLNKSELVFVTFLIIVEQLFRVILPFSFCWLAKLLLLEEVNNKITTINKEN